MSFCTIFLALLASADAGDFGPGDHTRSLKMGDQTRTYLVHVPPKFDPKKPTPVVLALHGATMSGPQMAAFTGLSDKADEAGFLVVYPNGTGGVFLTWNSGGGMDRIGSKADDVAFIGKVLDDLEKVATIDKKRVYACGMSNGAMMCYRLAAEMSDRIAAIAPVAGTVAIEQCKPKRPVPVMHFHGTLDKLVPIDGPSKDVAAVVKFLSVADTIKTWVKLNRCPNEPKTTAIPCKDDVDMKITRTIYGPGKDGAEVVLFVIEGAGHTWPGRDPGLNILGKSTHSISANDLIWDFFKRHPLE